MKRRSLLKVRMWCLKIVCRTPQLMKVGASLRSRFPSRSVWIRIQHDHLIQGIALSVSKNDGIFVDIGANRGLHLAFFSRCDPKNRHMAFEPLPELASELRNRFPLCEIHEVALSDSAGIVEFNEHPIAARSSIEDSSESRRKFSVRMARGDDFLEQKRVKFIKIDVEGHELEVLKGLTKTLATSKPHVVFEHAGIDSQRSAELFAFLAQHDYGVQSVLTGEVLTAERWTEVVSRAEDYNFLASHASAN